MTPGLIQDRQQKQAKQMQTSLSEILQQHGFTFFCGSGSSMQRCLA
jgi:hypothetical protein